MRYLPQQLLQHQSLDRCSQLLQFQLDKTGDSDRLVGVQREKKLQSKKVLLVIGRGQGCVQLLLALHQRFPLAEVLMIFRLCPQRCTSLYLQHLLIHPLHE